MNLPIRTRLSLSYFVIFSVAGILLCLASYWMARRSLYVELDHELDEHIDDVRDFIKARGLAGDLLRERAEVAAEFGLKDEGKWLQIQDAHGEWIYRSPHILAVPHDLPAIADVERQEEFTEFGSEPRRVHALLRTIQVDGHEFEVEDGITLTKTGQTLVLYRNGLLLMLPVLLAIAGVAGHLLSRGALGPVSALAREAQRIHHGNLQTRLPSPKTRDELAHLSTTLNEMLERIESGVRSVRDFTAYASHELRTPVAMIRTEADLALQFERSNGEYREALTVIGAEAQRMSSLLDSLLFLARTDAGTEEAKLEPVDARRACAQACGKWRGLFQRARIELTMSLPPDAVVVLADGAYLQRLLNIVLENAGKYTPPGGTVQLTVERASDRALFRISDTGIGIPPMDQPHVFERFRRGANAAEGSAQGSGLGLALAAWIAERHHTAIEVDSAVGRGSTFSWYLALASQRMIAESSSLSAALENPASVAR